MSELKSWLSSRPILAAGLGLLAIAATSLAVTVGLATALQGGPGATAPASAAVVAVAPSLSASPSSVATPPATPAAASSPTDSPSPTPAPTAPPMPSLLGAIGDSYSQAYSVTPEYLRDHAQFSWVIGTAKNDGVYSLLERFRALGGSPAVVDAATSGRKMDDAPRQATAVAAAAGKLSPGQTAYVTFELGTNDLCDYTQTDPTAFEANLRSAISILRAGLPPGSRILMMSVPDFGHFRDITQADPKAVAALAALSLKLQPCPPFLGDKGTVTVAQAETYLSLYDASLAKVCDEIAVTDGATGKLYCTSSESLLSLRDFTISDLSTVDYFHPSLGGQARMADAAWSADAWKALPLPSGAAAASAAEGIVAAVPTAPAAAPALAWIWPTAARRRRRSHLRAHHEPRGRIAARSSPRP